MKFNVETNRGYSHFTSVLQNITSFFSGGGKTIHKARNELKIITLEEIECVVKAFKVPNAINQFAYAYLRRSKAYKSYHNAITLQELEVNTPEPIGYIEFYRFGLLKESFFISKALQYDFTMAHVRDDNPEDKTAILKAFADFTYEVHRKGVWHVDYSGGNILINHREDGYRFSLVDINRMEFKTINGYEGLENFNKMWFDESSLTIIAERYAEQADLDKTEAVKAILSHDAALRAHVLRRRKFKKLLLGR